MENHTKVFVGITLRPLRVNFLWFILTIINENFFKFYINYTWFSTSNEQFRASYCYARKQICFRYGSSIYILKNKNVIDFVLTYLFDSVSGEYSFNFFVRLYPYLFNDVLEEAKTIQFLSLVIFVLLFILTTFKKIENPVIYS